VYPDVLFDSVPVSAGGNIGISDKTLRGLHGYGALAWAQMRKMEKNSA